MRNFCKIGFFVILLSLVQSFTSSAQTASTKYKCMIQMTNYMGEGAYVAVSPD